MKTNVSLRLFILFLILHSLSACSAVNNALDKPPSASSSVPGIQELLGTLPIKMPTPSPTSAKIDTIRSIQTPDFSTTPAKATQTYKDIHRFSLNDKSWTFFGNASGELYDDIYSIAIASEQDIWFSSRSGYLLRFDGTQMVSYTLPMTNLLGTKGIGNLVIDQNKNVWIAAFEAGAIRFDGTSWHHYTTQQGLPEEVDRLLIGPDKTLWAVMHQPARIYRLNQHTWELYWSMESEQANQLRINSIAIDSTGKFWIQSYGSLSTLDHQKWYQFPSHAFPISSFCGLAEVRTSPDGSIWINQCESLDLIHFASEKYWNILRMPVPDNAQLPGEGSLYIAPDGSVWSGVVLLTKPKTNILLHWNGKAWTLYDGFPTDERIPSSIFNVLAITNDRTVWIATKLGIYRYKP